MFIVQVYLASHLRDAIKNYVSFFTNKKNLVGQHSYRSWSQKLFDFYLINYSRPKCLSEMYLEVLESCCSTAVDYSLVIKRPMVHALPAAGHFSSSLSQSLWCLSMDRSLKEVQHYWFFHKKMLSFVARCELSLFCSVNAKLKAKTSSHFQATKMSIFFIEMLHLPQMKRRRLQVCIPTEKKDFPCLSMSAQNEEVHGISNKWFGC